MATSWMKRRPTQYICICCLSFHDVWINFLGFIVGLISRCCSRRASVERSLCLKWLTMSFPTSSIPAILFLNFADDALQVTSPKAPFCVQNFFLEGLCSLEERYTATTLWCSMAKATGRSRLTSRSFSATCSPVWLPRKTTSPKQTDQIFKSSSTKFAHLVAKARGSVRRDWKEIAKLKAKYSILDLQLPACAAAVSFVATLFAAGAQTDAAFHGCRSAQTHFFFCSTNVR